MTAQKTKFPIKDFFSKCDHSHRKLLIWSHLLEDFIICVVVIHSILNWPLKKPKTKALVYFEKVQKIAFMLAVIFWCFRWMNYVILNETFAFPLRQKYRFLSSFFWSVFYLIQAEEEFAE